VDHRAIDYYSMQRVDSPHPLHYNCEKTMTLKDFRDKNNITQKQVADLLGVDVTTVSRYEREVGKIRPGLKSLYLLGLISKNQITVTDFLTPDELVLSENFADAVKSILGYDIPPENAVQG